MNAVLGEPVSDVRGETGVPVRAAWWTVVAVFLMHGLVVSTWVSRIAAVKRLLGVGDAALGSALLGSAVGSMFGIPVCGWAVDRFGTRRVTQAATVGFALSLLPLALAPNVYLLGAALVLFGAFAGAQDVAMNALGVGVEKRLGVPTMSRFHAMFSLGGMAGSAAGAAVAAAGMAPAGHFGSAAVVVVLLLVAVNRWLPDSAPEPAREGSGERRWSVPPLPVLVLSAIGFCIFLSEGAIADWTSVYLSEVLHAREALTAAGYGVFSASMTIFRLSGDAITLRLGRRRTVRTGALLGAGGLLLVAAAPGPGLALAGLAVAGAGFSSIIPLVFAASARVSSVSEAAGVATVSGIGYLGFLVGPPTIGYVSEFVSLRAGMCVLVALSSLAALLVGVLRRRSLPGADPLG